MTGTDAVLTITGMDNTPTTRVSINSILENLLDFMISLSPDETLRVLPKIV